MATTKKSATTKKIAIKNAPVKVGKKGKNSIVKNEPVVIRIVVDVNINQPESKDRLLQVFEADETPNFCYEFKLTNLTINRIAIDDTVKKDPEQ